MAKETVHQTLLERIGGVSSSATSSEGYSLLLQTLLREFQFDQGMIWEFNESTPPEMIFGIDSSRRVLHKQEIDWVSDSILEKIKNKKEPVLFWDEPAQSSSESIRAKSLKHIVGLPVNGEPFLAIYLASKKDPTRVLSETELKSLEIAAQASVVALKQQKAFHQIKKENQELKLKIKGEQGNFLIQSDCMLDLLQQVKKIAPFNVSVLVQGKSGTGKEELAREIHRLSGRTGRFIAINCANLTETLLESELFGYQKGAFTGADANKTGLFQEAHHGTFFLDEIAELSLTLQSKLLRVLQERVVRPIGSSRDIPIDVRVISASHQDLKEAVQEKRFREDLYFRLQEITFSIPSLSARPEDIELLSQHFIQRFSQEFQLTKKGLTPAALTFLKNHSWPGNIRELMNVCRTAVILSSNNLIDASDLRIHAPASASVESILTQDSGPLKEKVADFEYRVVKKILEQTGKTQEDAAQELDVSVRTVQRILNRNE